MKTLIAIVLLGFAVFGSAAMIVHSLHPAHPVATAPPVEERATFLMTLTYCLVTVSVAPVPKCHDVIEHWASADDCKTRAEGLIQREQARPVALRRGWWLNAWKCAEPVQHLGPS